MKTVLQLKKILLTIGVSLAFFGFQTNAWSQIVAFNNAWSGSPATVNATTTNANLSTVTLSRGAGLTASSSTAGFRSTGFASGSTVTLSNNDYVTFTVTANSGYFINLNDAVLTLSLGSSGTGPQTYGVYTSVGGFSSQLGANLTATNSQARSFPSTGYNGLASIEIRIYGWNASATTGTGGPSSISLTGAVVVSNVAPTATASISGTTEVGQTLTGLHTFNDTDGDLEGTSTYQWYRADNGSGLNVAPIASATSNSYLLTPADAGKFIRFGVVPVAATGTSPGAQAFSSYVGPVTTSANNLSTITSTIGFVPASNVNYQNYLGSDVTASSLEVAKFSVNDIAGAPNDGFPTTLTAVTFSLSNFEQYEKVALYDDTNTEIQELSSAATLNFTGLTITAASGALKSFSIRATFKTSVTDNVQPQLTITAASADSNGSLFAAPNAGGASSSVANDDNKIEVLGTQLTFIQNTTNTLVGANMTPAVTVRAVDANNNTDLDFTGNVTILSSGTLSAPQSQAAVNGVATFATISHTTPQIGLMLTASAGGLSYAVSTPFNVTVQEAGVLLFEENFGFTGLLTANGYTLTGGAATPTLSAGATGLSYTNYGSTNIGNGLAMATSGQDVNHPFTPTQLADSTTYLSFLVNVTAAQATGDYFIHLGPSTIGSEFRGRVYARLNSGNLQFGVSTSGATIVYGTTNYALNNTYLVVLKYTYSSTTGTATIYVNPSLYAEPSIAEATQSSTGIVNTNVGAVGIRQGGAANAATLTIDGIRVATNWGTALGNPQYITNANINAGHYNTVSVLDGTLTAAGSVTVNNGITINSGDFIIPNNVNLIQTGTGVLNNNSGSVTVRRNAQMRRSDYVYWGSPVQGQDITDFSPETLANRFYEISETTNAYVPLVDTDFVAGKGYVIRAPNTLNPNGSLQTFNGEFNGVPNNGDITHAMTLNGQGFNLLANPYPSTISAQSFLNMNTSVSTLYFWTHMLNAAAGTNYATFNGTGAASASGSEIPNGTIQVGQGFLAKTNAATNATFNNAMRVNNTAGQFFRTATVERNRLWLNLSNNEGALNQALIGYVSDATNAIDEKFDGKLIELQGSKLYSVIDNSEYVIQGRALPFETTDEVALGFKAATDGTYTISLNQVDGLFSEDQAIFIKDNVTGTIHNIKESNYTFAANAGTYNNRFAVVYQSAPLAIENPTLDANNVIVYNQQGVLNINAGNTVMQSVKIFDIRGRLVFENNAINATTTTVANLNLSKQVLVVQIISSDNKTISKKVVY